MRVRDWQDVISDVVERDVEPDRWRGVGGGRSEGIGEDIYLGHPNAGLFHLKTYAKNPFEVKGVGTQVARKLDDEIGSYLPEESPARFAVNAGPEDEEEAETRAKRLEETIKAHASAPTTPDALFDDVMEAIDSPAFGPLEYENPDRPEGVDELATTFEEAEDLLESEFEEIVADDEVGRGFQ